MTIEIMQVPGEDIEKAKLYSKKEETYRLALESIQRWVERDLNDSAIVDAIASVVKYALEDK